jgi:predicted porin
MRKSLVALAIAGAFSGSAFAQSSVTLYGLLDVSIHESNLKKAGNDLFFDEGAFQGPRLGFKGKEDLGGGTYAIFDIENGFVPGSGAIDQQGQLFGRQAWVGLSGDAWGAVTAGRQYGENFAFLGDYDPLGWGNWSTNSWELFISGLRFDNTLQYTGTFGPVTFGLGHAFGGVAGSSQADSTNEAGLKFATGIFSVGASFMDTDDTLKNKVKSFGVGGSVALTPVTIQALFMDKKTGAGFLDGAGNTLSPGTRFQDGNALTQRQDKYWSLGATLDIPGGNQAILTYMRDKETNVTDAIASGTLQTAYLVLDHHFSKRTDIYFGLDYTKVGSGLVGEGLAADAGFDAGAGSKTKGTDYGIGLRHKF